MISNKYLIEKVRIRAVGELLFTIDRIEKLPVFTLAWLYIAYSSHLPTYASAFLPACLPCARLPAHFPHMIVNSFSFTKPPPLYSKSLTKAPRPHFIISAIIKILHMNKQHIQTNIDPANFSIEADNLEKEMKFALSNLWLEEAGVKSANYFYEIAKSQKEKEEAYNNFCLAVKKRCEAMQIIEKIEKQIINLKNNNNK